MTDPLQHTISEALDNLAMDIMTARTKSDALALSQSLRDVSSLCVKLAEALPL